MSEYVQWAEKDETQKVEHSELEKKKKELDDATGLALTLCFLHFPSYVFPMFNTTVSFDLDAVEDNEELITSLKRKINTDFGGTLSVVLKISSRWKLTVVLNIGWL
jgi:hypothetical protein